MTLGTLAEERVEVWLERTAGLELGVLPQAGALEQSRSSPPPFRLGGAHGSCCHPGVSTAAALPRGPSQGWLLHPSPW